MGRIVRRVLSAISNGLRRVGRAIVGGMHFAGRSARRQDPDLIDPKGLHIYDSKEQDEAEEDAQPR